MLLGELYGNPKSLEEIKRKIPKEKLERILPILLDEGIVEYEKDRKMYRLSRVGKNLYEFYDEVLNKVDRLTLSKILLFFVLKPRFHYLLLYDKALEKRS